jgi:hypothetical protein
VAVVEDAWWDSCVAKVGNVRVLKDDADGERSDKDR